MKGEGRWRFSGKPSCQESGTATSAISYTYDAAGRLVTRVDALKRTTRYTHTPAGQLEGIDYPTTADVVFTYDQQGRRLSIKDGSGETTWTHDAAGRVATETQERSGRRLTQTYDQASLRTDLTVAALDQAGASIGEAWTTSFAYDNAGRLMAVLDPRVSSNKPFVYSYAEKQNVKSELSTPFGQILSFEYDTQGRLLGTTLKGAASHVLATHAYTYDLASQRSTASTLSGTTSYAYDAQRQVVSATEKALGAEASAPASNEFGYAYDPIGNRQTARTVMNQTQVAEEVSYDSNAVNQYTELTTKIAAGTSMSSPVLHNPAKFNPLHDANGNCTWLPSGLTLDYDEENRLIATATSTGREEYSYDGFGRRVEKRSYSSLTQTAPDKVVRYVYDGWRVMEELSATQAGGYTFSVARSYTRGTDLSGTPEGAGGIGSLLAATRDPLGSPSTACYFHDGNGNVSALVGASDAVLARYSYTPFGETMSSSGSWAAENTYRFSAKEQDDGTGLYYYGLRYYNPFTGRWLSSDPIEEEGGLNLYGYVDNDPINCFDPLGLASQGNIIPSELQNFGKNQAGEVGKYLAEKYASDPSKQKALMKAWEKGRGLRGSRFFKGGKARSGAEAGLFALWLANETMLEETGISMWERLTLPEGTIIHDEPVYDNCGKIIDVERVYTPPGHPDYQKYYWIMMRGQQA